MDGSYVIAANKARVVCDTTHPSRGSKASNIFSVEHAHVQSMDVLLDDGGQ